MKYKGIILAGGMGTRLYPASLPISKILLPIYDKPMIYYPLSTLISAGIEEILIITNTRDIDNFKRVLKDGSHIGVSISYMIQQEPLGIAHSFILAEEFLRGSNAVLILGDNIIYGREFSNLLKKVIRENIYATIFGVPVDNPSAFGVIEFDKGGNVISLEEKPKYPKSNYAAVGLYVYNEDVVSLAKQLVPSSRNELEITDLNKLYLNKFQLKSILLDKSIYWQDTGSFNSLLEASLFIKNEEKKIGRKIGCIEEEALRAGFIKKKSYFRTYVAQYCSDYYKYLFELGENRHHA